MPKRLEDKWHTTEEILNRYSPELWDELIIAIGYYSAIGDVETKDGMIRMTELAMLRLAGFSAVGNPN